MGKTWKDSPKSKQDRRRDREEKPVKKVRPKVMNVDNWRTDRDIEEIDDDPYDDSEL
jgi:hypothetical protein